MDIEYTKLIKQRKRYILTLACIFFMQIMLILVAGNIGNIVYDILSSLMIIIMMLLIYIYQPEIFLKYLWFIIISIWGIVAVFILENGSVALRGKVSYHYGSFPIYSLSWIVFWGVIIIKEINKRVSDIKYEKNYNYNEIVPSKITIKNLKLISYCAIVWMLICFISIINKPYFLYGIDRFQYNKEFMPQIVSKSMQFLYALIPIPLMLRKEDKKLAYIYCGVFTLLNFWCGEKFTGLIIIFYFVMLVINPVYISEKMKKYTKRIIKIIGFLIILLLCIVILQQFILGLKISDISSYFENRIAAQGELWWLMYSKDASNGMHLNEISDEINVLVNQPSGEMSDYYFGIYKMMKLFMKSDWVKYALANGVRATESTRVTFYYYGKIPGIIIGQAILAIFIFYVVNKIVVNSNQRKWILACGYMYLFKSLITVSIMSDFQLLTTTKMILVYIVLFVFSNKKKLTFRSRKNE